MRIWKPFAFLTFLFSFSPNVMAYPAWCAGGPRAPSYAFSNAYDAQNCAFVIAQQSRDCSRFARMGQCNANPWEINRFASFYCLCNTAKPAAGYWLSDSETDAD